MMSSQPVRRSRAPVTTLCAAAAAAACAWAPGAMTLASIPQSAADDNNAPANGIMTTLCGDMYSTVFWPLLVVTACLAWRTRPKADAAEVPAGFSSFQFRYLLAWFLCVGADWLQGPYVYALYASYGYTPSEIARLFVAGFGSSMICGTFIGSVADAWGRKMCALLYCVLYIAACVTKHTDNYAFLMVGRVLGGAATSLLFSTFECWMVAEHNRRNFGDGLLRYMFGLMFFVQYLAAIAAGLLAQAAATAIPLTKLGDHGFFYGGYTTPFLLSALFLVVAIPIIQTLWDENYGQGGQAESGILASLKKGGEAMFSSWKVPVIGLAVSAFEGSMYAFVFNWTPALDAGADTPPPHGLIFSAFMMACMCGSSIFGMLDTSIAPTKALVPVVVAAAISLSMVAFSLGQGAASAAAIFAGFLAFEACVGAYFPCMGMVKSQVVPEDCRAGVYNLYRVPLNAFVLVLLLTDLSLATAFTACAGLLAFAGVAVLAVHLAK